MEAPPAISWRSESSASERRNLTVRSIVTGPIGGRTMGVLYQQNLLTHRKYDFLGTIPCDRGAWNAGCRREPE